MTMKEIFSKLSSHMIEGMMVHEQLMELYLFLSLPGYSKCHEYHYFSESLEHVRFQQFVLTHHDILTSPNRPSDPALIPDNWYNFKRSDVDQANRLDAMRSAFETWVRWETDTKTLYEDAYCELFRLGHIRTCDYISARIADVSEELTFAEHEWLSKKAMSYDIVSIMEEQKAFEKTYSKKIRKLLSSSVSAEV